MTENVLILSIELLSGLIVTFFLIDQHWLYDYMMHLLPQQPLIHYGPGTPAFKDSYLYSVEPFPYTPNADAFLEQSCFVKKQSFCISANTSSAHHQPKY